MTHFIVLFALLLWSDTKSPYLHGTPAMHFKIRKHNAPALFFFLKIVLAVYNLL